MLGMVGRRRMGEGRGDAMQALAGLRAADGEGAPRGVEDLIRVRRPVYRRLTDREILGVEVSVKGGERVEMGRGLHHAVHLNLR
jgi:hypothetical protein